MIVSSPTRIVHKDKFISNPSVLQEIEKDILDGKLSDKEVVPEEMSKLADKELKERVHALEERVRLLAKFTIKVTRSNHYPATNP